MQTGANISQLFLSASGFLHRFFFLDDASFRKALLIISGQHRKDALTNFFVLSNIRFVSGGSSEMLRTSRCFREALLQSVGSRTPAAVALLPYNFSSSFEEVSATRRDFRCIVRTRSKSLFLRSANPDQFSFEPGFAGAEGAKT